MHFGPLITDSFAKPPQGHPKATLSCTTLFGSTNTGAQRFQNQPSFRTVPIKQISPSSMAATPSQDILAAQNLHWLPVRPLLSGQTSLISWHAGSRKKDRQTQRQKSGVEHLHRLLTSPPEEEDI